MRFVKTGILAALALGAMALGGCATVQSSSLEPTTSTGIPYSLPEGRLQLTIVEDKGKLSVQLGGPVVIPDQNHRMVAHLPHGGTSDNNVTITVDAATNLLEKVDATSTGKLSAIISSAVGSLAYQSSQSTSGVVLFDMLFEANETAVNDVMTRVNDALKGYYEARCVTGLALLQNQHKKALKEAGYDPKPALKERLVACRSLTEAGLGKEEPLISLTVGSNTYLAKSPPTDPAKEIETVTIKSGPAETYGLRQDCGLGVCFRAFKPVEVGLQMGDYLKKSGVFLIPDKESLVLINLRSGVFAEQKYVLTFTDGMLTSYTQNSQNELQGLVGLPGAIVADTIKKQTEALGLRKSELEAETALLNAAQANIEAQLKTRQTCDNNQGGCGATVYRLLRIDVNEPEGASASTANDPPVTDPGGGAGSPPIGG